MTVHNYRPRQFHRTSNGENPSSRYRDMGSAILAAARPPPTVTTIPLKPGGLRGKKVGRRDGRTDGRTDRQTDRQTDWTSDIAAWSQLKMYDLLLGISLKFVPKFRINNIPALVQIMVWHWPGTKPLSEQMMVNLLMYNCICITQPQMS